MIRPLDGALTPSGGIAVLAATCGNLAPDGSVLQPSAASPHLLRHRGRTVVFEVLDDFRTRIADETLDIDED